MLGPSCAPTVNASATDDFRSFSVAIFPCEFPPICVRGYNLTITENGESFGTMTLGQNGLAYISDVNPCKYTYIFEALMTAKDGQTSLSSRIAGQVNFSGVYYNSVQF